MSPLNPDNPDRDPELLAWPEAHRTWARIARGTMIMHGAEGTAVDSLLAQARQSLQASGRTPTELFGRPESYGRSNAKGLRTAVSLLEGPLPFSTMAGTWQALSISLGVILAVLGVWLGVEDGWKKSSLSGSVLLLFLLVSALVGVAFWGWVVHTRGQLHTARALWLGALAACGAVIAAASFLDDFALDGPPNWIMVVVGTGVCVLGFGWPHQRERALIDDCGWSDARWFARAENLLRGRYRFSRAQAVESLREAKYHRARTGDARPLAAEFGNVEVFAAQLATSNHMALKRGVLFQRIISVSALLLWGGVILMPMALRDGLTVLTGFGVFLWVLFLGGVIKAWRPAPMEAEARRLKRQRERTAATLGTEEQD